MKSKLDNLPRYQTSDINLPAKLYNQVKLALLNNDQAIRIKMEKLKNIDVILDHEYWVCVDTSLNDIPIFAWTEFKVSHRTNLHKPIESKLYSYHAHAELIIEKVTQQIEQQLQIKLAVKILNSLV